MRSPFFKKLPSCLLGAVIAASTAVSVPVSAVDGNPPGLFELDGNTVDGTDASPPDPFAGVDWGYLYNTNNPLPANMVDFTGILRDLSPATIFWKGGSKDVEDVTEWWYKNGSVSDKSDITDAYAAAFTNTKNICLDAQSKPVECAAGSEEDAVHSAGDLIVYFGMDRYGNDGDTFGGFWFFQDPEVGLVPNTTQGEWQGAHVKRDGDQPGDVLVLVEYPQASGSTPVIKVYEWDPDDLDNNNVAPNLELLYTETQAKCDGWGDKWACAIVNTVALPGEPAWPYIPKGGTDASPLPAQSFFEGGINLTKILGATPCISSFLAETRSSRSETASLEDFAFGDFEVCGATVSKSCESEISDNGDKVIVSFKGTVSNTGALPLDIELDDDKGEFTAVCYDNNSSGICGDTVNSVADTAPSPLGLGDKATFTLGGGQTVLYEGSYELTTFDENTEFVDTVTMIFSDPVTGDPIGDPVTAISENCPPDGDPSLAVTKVCTSVTVSADGTEIDRVISGAVTNDGNVKLDNIVLDDSVLDTTGDTHGFEVLLDDGDGVVEDNGDDVEFNFTTGYLEPGDKLWYKFTFSNTDVDHTNTMTVYGDNVFDPEADPESASAELLECDPDLAPAVGITKVCVPEGNGVSLVLEGGKLVVKVTNRITVSNTGNEALEITLQDDKVAALVEDGTAVFQCTSSPTTPASCTGTLNANTSVSFEQHYYPVLGEGPLNDSSLEFDNTASITSATGVLSDTPVTPDPASDTAECPLCPAPSTP